MKRNNEKTFKLNIICSDSSGNLKAEKRENNFKNR